MRNIIAATALAVLLAPSTTFHVDFPKPDKIIGIYTSPECHDSECSIQLENELSKYYERNSDKDLAELAALLDYRWDGALADIVYDVISKKGDKMTHFLYIKMITDSVCLKKKEPYCVPERDREERFMKHIVYLREGVYFLHDDEKCFDKKIIEYDKKAIRLAVDTFKSDTGYYPTYMFELQRHMEEKYRIILRIHNPCGGKYKYKKDGDSFTIE